MHYNVNNLKGYAIGATDGDIGKLDDFYFDDKFWTIRYLVAETGNWLLNRKVLISPFALGKADLSQERLNVALTKKQVEESPSMDTDMPVSGRHEALYLDYYGYPYYWEGPLLWGPMAYPQFSDADRKRDEEARAMRETHTIRICEALMQSPAIISRLSMATSVMSKTSSSTKKHGRFAIWWSKRRTGGRVRKCSVHRRGKTG